jgi:hypothetical protein
MSFHHDDLPHIISPQHHHHKFHPPSFYPFNPIPLNSPPHLLHHYLPRQS